MTLYDEYRKQYPINPEPSEFRDIIESEIKRVIAWMEGRKPLPAEEIKPGHCPALQPRSVPSEPISYELTEIVRAWLKNHGFDGLYMTGECACVVDDLFPCGHACPDCSAGYIIPCDCGDHDYHIGPRPDANGATFRKVGE